MNKLPKIFCLTLKDTPKRTDRAKEHFELNDLDVNFFEGINGNSFGLKTTIPYKDDNPNGPNYYISSGHVGCILSHVMLWKTLQYLPYEEIIIFEDDVILDKDFKQNFINYYKQLPLDWEYVFLGHCCLPNEECITKINDNVLSSTVSPMCTHAYMIKKTALSILIETNNKAWAHIDIQIQKNSLKRLKHYIFYPTIADQLSIYHNHTSELRSLTADWTDYINKI